jgi:hypothetical protein
VGIKWWTQKNYASLDMQKYSDASLFKGKPIERKDGALFSSTDLALYEQNSKPVVINSIS